MDWRSRHPVAGLYCARCCRDSGGAVSAPSFDGAAYMYLAFVPMNILTLFSAGVLNGLQHYSEFQLVRLLVIVATVAGLGALALTNLLSVHDAVFVYLAANGLTLTIAPAS